MNTTLKYIIGLIVVAAVVVGIVFAVKAGKKDADVVVTNENTTSLCYAWNTEAGDHAALRMNFVMDKPTVTGSFDWIPAEKDKKTGTFEGSFDGDGEDGEGSATVWWKTSGEGISTTEQLFIQFSDSTAGAGFGEMKDRGDGTYVYANPNQISYAPILSRVDCNDAAMGGKTAGKLPAGSAANGNVSTFTAHTWVWQKTVMSDGTIIIPKKPAAFTLMIGSDNHVSGTTDCNNFSGSYNMAMGNAIGFDSLISTQMYCEGSQEAVFTNALAKVNHFTFTKSGDLVLSLKNNEASIIFTKK